jgi:hypothetical protein
MRLERAVLVWSPPKGTLAYVLALGFGFGHSCTGTLADLFPFHLRQPSQDRHDELSGWRGRVDTLTHRHQAHVVAGEAFLHQRQQLRCGSTEPV